jgi:mRNA-degrading endonuclease toxin of MazEF toxin-antitoxin module
MFQVVVSGKNGKALCDQVRVYNKTRLIKKLGTLRSEKEMKDIGEKILLLLDFEELIDLY